MAAIVYLDVEDEITTAAARIRHADEQRVAMVIPFGSRVATSRINFRLLAREAVDAGRRLDIVAPDASARALATSAGLAVFASVGDFEAALESGEPAPVQPSPGTAAKRPPDAAGGAPAPGAGPGGVRSGGTARGRGASSRPAGGQMPLLDDTEPVAGAITAPSRSAASGAALHEAPAAERPRGRARGPLLAAVLVLVLVLALGGAAAALALPSATITVTPVMDAVTPIALTVRADSSATAVDTVNDVIPATSLDVPLTAQGEFTATGTNVTQTSATGQVTFDSINTVSAIPIPRGTRVSTLDGVTFATTASVVVPRATVSGSTIAHGLSSVGVTAVSSGPRGNVGAKAIDQVPSSYAALQISVSNGTATSGGERTETPKILAADIKAATDQLSKDLGDELASAVGDPALAPDGATVYPDTAQLGEPTYTPDTAGLDGKVLKAGQATFTLQADATATVVAVDASPLKGMGEAALRAAVTAGDQIVADSIDVVVGDGTVGEDGTVSFTVTGSALEQHPLDAEALKAAVLGKSPDAAKAALAAYGKVDVALSPFWVSAVPDSADKVTLTIATAERPPATPTPAPTATPRPTPRPTRTPEASPSSPGPSDSPVDASPVPSG